MARRRRISIDTGLEDLSHALQRARGTSSELPIRFLYELKCAPDRPFEETARRLEIPVRTAYVWIGVYEEKGFDGYRSHRWKARQIKGKAPGPPRSTESTPKEIGDHDLLQLLTNVPDSPDVITWCLEMKRWLSPLFPGVDQFGVSLAGNIDLFDPGNSATGKFLFQATVATEGGAGGEGTVHVEGMDSGKLWQKIFRKGVADGQVDPARFHPPIGDDYFYTYREKSAYIGSINLLTRLENPPISDEELARFRTLRPLFSRLMAEAVARIQLADPQVREYYNAMARVDPDKLLTTRERDVVLLHLMGYRNEEIARSLSVDTSTIKTHTATILRKLGLNNVKELMGKAFSVRHFFTGRKPDDLDP